jgi:enoyl-[acyl-carrier protein] reductase I
MGTVKAALESATRFGEAELGPKWEYASKRCRRGPLQTRAASGFSNFQDMMRLAIEKSPNRALATIEDVDAYAAFLASDLAKSVNGTIP